MRRKIKFTLTADEQLTAFERTPSKAAPLDQIRKAIGYLEIDPHHPSLHTHEFTSLAGANGEKSLRRTLKTIRQERTEFSGSMVPMRSKERCVSR